MKILHCHISLSTGGVESMVTGLVNTMSETYQTDVCLLYEPKESDIYLKKLKKEITVFTIGKQGTGFSFLSLLKIVNFLSKANYDIIQLHGFFYYYLLPIFFLHKKKKFFYTVHNDALLENNKWDRKILKLKRFFFKKGWVSPITISDSSQKSFEEFYNDCPNTRIYNGIPSPKIKKELKNVIEKYRMTSNTKIFINPARITEQKNQLVLVKVFQKLILEGHDIVLLIAGQCQDNKILASLQPYFSDRIKYIGEIDNIPSLLNFCDGMCLPSLWEGMPVVLLEALAVGCPTIAAPVGGVQDVIKDGINGILSTNSSENKYYESMIRFLALGEESIGELRNRAKESFLDYEIHNTVQKYFDVYLK